MASKLWLVVVLLALVVVTESSTLLQDPSALGLSRLTSADGNGGTLTCNGRIGACIGDEEEELLGSDDAHRLLAGRRRYISYDALKKNNVPCNRRGRSYYNCNSNARANPYHRGCTYITHCARNLG